MRIAIPVPVRRWGAAVLVAAVGLGCAVWYWRAGGTEPPDAPPGPQNDPPPPDPRAVFDTPFRNVRPGVNYVGSQACTSCHEQITRAYLGHPMGRSAEWVVGPEAADRHSAGSSRPVTAGGFELRITRQGDRLFHSVAAPRALVSVPAYKVAADLAVGSGRQGHSYITFEEGAAWQSPLSWFRHTASWEVSPGFDLGGGSRRPVAPTCLFCHTDGGVPVAGALNRYDEPLFRFGAAIGCERCHGPGELHAAEHAAGLAAGPDHSIVNPARLPADLRGDVCRQCHFQGEARTTRRGRDLSEYRPGLPLDQFVSVFVTPSALSTGRQSVGQVEQMELSRCYVGSGGRLACTSCHDPHSVPDPDGRAGYYRDRCLTCHEPQGCSSPEVDRRVKGDSCIACHMPARASSNIVHAAVTDHRVLRRPDAAPRPGPPPEGLPLVPYRPGPLAPPAEERERDWAVTLGQELARDGAGKVPPGTVKVVRSKLEAALARWPGDAAAWSALAGAHVAGEDGRAALAAARRAAALSPESETVLIRLAQAADAAGDYRLVAETAQRLAGLNPSSSDHRVTIATALVHLAEWRSAEAEARAALSLHPLHPNAWLVRAVCTSRLGDPRAARAELDTALCLAPSSQQRKLLSEWYLRHTR